MTGMFTLYIIHIAGTRMIESGIDGLSREVKEEAIVLGKDIMDCAPLNLPPLTRIPKLSA